ncbi:MAG: FkbM family methyltransferase [Candidatus Chisholmbacteria bacterium]|nr:FkbM family methyltransferase [Candidatus Chisholmbacteria bacterium]
MNERYEPEVTAFMEQVLEPGLTVLDVGAHIGYHSLVARRFVGDSGKVVCFEPTPSTYEVLRRNCLHFPTMVLENIAINDGSTPTIDLKDYGTMYAAWNTSLEPRMTDREKRYLPKPRIVTVAAASIDAYCQQYRNIKPDFIKLDIENGEMAALIGAKDTISRCAPAIVFEGGDLARTDDNDTRACIDYLASTFGYSCFEFNFRYKTVVPHYPKPKGTYRGSYNILALPLER